MSRLRPSRLGACALLAFALAASLRGAPVAGADVPPPSPAPPPSPTPAPKVKPPPPPPPPAIPTVVHVPTDELDVLLRGQGRSVILRYDEYRALLDAARAKDGGPDAAPPQDVVRLSGDGTLDLTDERAGRFELVYRVRSLAPGPRSVGFDAGGVAFESLLVEAEGDAGPGRYEVREGAGRLHLDGPGVRRVTVKGSAVPSRSGAARRLDLWLPNPAAMSLAVTLPPGVVATLLGEGAPLTVTTPAERSSVVRTRPSRGGHLEIEWTPSAKGTEGPAILDAEVSTLYTVADGVIAVRSVVRADLLRTPADSLSLEVDPDLAVHAVEGPGVTGFSRSDDRRKVRVRLEKAVLGRLEVLVVAERPFTPGRGIDLPQVRAAGAVRHRGEAAVRFGPDVNARAVRVSGGRRVPAGGDPRVSAGVLRYALARADAGLSIDVEPGTLRVDASGTYYLSLAEPGQTLFAIVTYRVVEGTLYRLSPRFPREFDLRELSIDGVTTGFTRDVTADGRVEITLGKGVPVGGELRLLATLERARADWLPEKDHVAVPFSVPSAGVAREEAYVAVGADPGFEVLDGGAKDLVAVGAADLTARGLSSTGLVYGYRVDGPAPSVALDVARRDPWVEADVVTVLHPGPRRVDLSARAVYRIQRAGVLRLLLDLPSWAGDQVDVQAPSLRVATRLVGERRPKDVPAGYDRWQLDLERRALGTFVVTASWFLDRDADDWTLEADRPLLARAPLERTERLLVVRRSAGLEVSLPGLSATPDVRVLDVAEAPAEAAIDPLGVLEVLRLPSTREGVALAVRKHGGAAVLGAIATEVALRTAVSREGILRTRAEMTLFNIDRQFVEVRLPARSTLIGAVVGGVPVKPLVSPSGALLLTVPATLPTGTNRAPRVLVALTYETRLDGPPSGTVRVEAPRFPGLEVLHTTQEVGVEPDLLITGVSGDLLPAGRVAAPFRGPWILDLFDSVALKGATAGAAASKAVMVGSADAPRRGGRAAAGSLPMGGGEGGRPGEEGDFEVPPTPEETEQVHQADVVPKSKAEEPRDGFAREMPPPAAAEPPPTPTPATVPPPAPPSSPRPPSDAPVADGGPGAGDRSGDGKPGKPQGRAGEGGNADEDRRGATQSGRARKGQLSLDVPVFLAPNVVAASRVGGGGALELDLTSRAGRERAYLLLGLLAFAGGLAVIGWGRLPPWRTVLAGLVAAALLHLAFGASASTLVAAVADAFTALGACLALRWLVASVFGARTRPGAPPTPKPPPAAAPGAPPAAVAGLLLVAAAAFAAPAHAGDGPEPAPGAEPGTVIAPHDPAKGEELWTDDRVFLPLPVWLELERKAHPERDPELVALERVVTLVEASYALDVLATNAEGRARLVLAQRGRGTLLVPVPLKGLAIVEARLDGAPVRMLLDGGTYRVPLEREGDHVLDLRFQTPVVPTPAGRTFAFEVPTFAGSTLDVTAAGFGGELRVAGAGRVVASGAPGTGFSARAYLGRPTGTGPVQAVRGILAETRPEALQASVRTRAESRIVHSLRDGGTESALTLALHVLQGKAAFVDLSLPEGVEVLEAAGPEVARWETGDGRLRLVFVRPLEGKVGLTVRTFRPAAAPERREVVPELSVRDTTGESGLVVVNGDATLRLEAEEGPALFRTGRPAEPDAAGPDAVGRVLGAWRFAARPAPLTVRTERSQARTELDTSMRVTFGDERVRSVALARVRVQRAPVGELAFALPGVDEVRAVDAPGLSTWWIDGQGEARRLLVRFSDLFEGERTVTIRLERRLGGVHDGLALPRLFLEGAQGDRGELVVFALPDVEPLPGTAAGWKSLPPTRLEGQTSEVPGGRATHAFGWDAPVSAPLVVALRVPEQEVEAVVVSQISPSDEEQRLEHLVVFDVRRGATDRLAVFVPDGGLAASDVVRARDLRELRFEPATRTDADGAEVKGRLYLLRLQSRKGGLVEVTVSQRWPSGGVVHVVRPDGVKATRWFGLLRTFLDGEVEARVTAGAPDPVEWADLPFLPTGLERTAVLRTYAARAPYLVDVRARRHRIEAQADAVVLSARADGVVGLDGEVRVRVRYRLFNRARQFLPLRLPADAVLYGAVAAGVPVKPLQGSDGHVLLPVPKVPLGGAGYEVSITYRAPVGRRFERGGSGTLLLPQVVGVEVDRTVISLRVPSGYTYAFDTKMSESTEREAVGDVVEASLREAQEVLKVAQTGTLEQRRLACATTTPLVDGARQRLADYKQRGASRERVAQLETELTKLAQVQAEALTRCEMDATVARNEERFEANTQSGSNANGQALLAYLGEQAGGEGERQVPPPGAELGANWGFNGESGDGGGGGGAGKNKELVELKQRLQGALEQRGLEERRKNAAQQEAEPQGATRRLPGEGRASAPQQTLADEETLRVDQSRNNVLLNDRLRQVEGTYRGGWRGGVADAAKAPGVSGPASPSSGPAGLLPGRLGPAGGPADGIDDAAAAARVGLMGVDVPLPTDGIVYWFTGARAGAAVSFDASREGMSPWLRALLSLGLFGAFGFGLARLARRSGSSRGR